MVDWDGAGWDGGGRDGMWCCAVRCGAVRCGTVRCGAVRCGAVRGGAMRCDAMRCGAVRCGAMRCDAMRCDAMRACLSSGLALATATLPCKAASRTTKINRPTTIEPAYSCTGSEWLFVAQAHVGTSQTARPFDLPQLPFALFTALPIAHPPHTAAETARPRNMGEL